MITVSVEWRGRGPQCVVVGGLQGVGVREHSGGRPAANWGHSPSQTFMETFRGGNILGLLASFRAATKTRNDLDGDEFLPEQFKKTLCPILCVGDVVHVPDRFHTSSDRHPGAWKQSSRKGGVAMPSEGAFCQTLQTLNICTK